jgi:hypothetical protein
MPCPAAVTNATLPFNRLAMPSPVQNREYLLPFSGLKPPTASQSFFRHYLNGIDVHARS